MFLQSVSLQEFKNHTGWAFLYPWQNNKSVNQSWSEGFTAHHELYFSFSNRELILILQPFFFFSPLQTLQSFVSFFLLADFNKEYFELQIHNNAQHLEKLPFQKVLFNAFHLEAKVKTVQFVVHRETPLLWNEGEDGRTEDQAFIINQVKGLVSSHSEQHEAAQR